MRLKTSPLVTGKNFSRSRTSRRGSPRSSHASKAGILSSRAPASRRAGGSVLTMLPGHDGVSIARLPSAPGAHWFRSDRMPGDLTAGSVPPSASRGSTCLAGYSIPPAATAAYFGVQYTISPRGQGGHPVDDADVAMAGRASHAPMACSSAMPSLSIGSSSKSLPHSVMPWGTQ